MAYPEKARNPIHEGLAPLAAVVAQRWDDGYGPFPPTTFQISNLKAGTGATNVIPGTLSAEMNFRFNPGQSPEGLQAQVEARLKEANCDYTLTWNLSGRRLYRRRRLDRAAEVTSRRFWAAARAVYRRRHLRRSLRPED